MNQFMTLTENRKAPVVVVYTTKNDLVNSFLVYYRSQDITSVLHENDLREIEIQCDMHLGSQ
jgi:hypothetical protein